MCLECWEDYFGSFAALGSLFGVMLGLLHPCGPYLCGQRLILGALRPRRLAQPATKRWARFRLYNPISTANRSVFLAKPRYRTLA